MNSCVRLNFVLSMPSEVVSSQRAQNFPEVSCDELAAVEQRFELVFRKLGKKGVALDDGRVGPVIGDPAGRSRSGSHCGLLVGVTPEGSGLDGRPSRLGG